MAKILIIDDDAGIRHALERRLSHQGHAVETAANAQEVWSLRNPCDFDLLLLDIRMPEYDSLDVFASLHSQTGDRRQPGKTCFVEPPPVVVITAHPEDRSVWMLRELPQVKDVLAKPFSFVDLETAIAKALTPRCPSDRPAPPAPGAAQVRLP